MSSIINFRIIEECRAFFFITEYDVDTVNFIPVDIDNLIIEDVKRFYTALIVNTLESDNRQHAIDDLEARIGINQGGSVGVGIGGHVSIVDATPTSTGAVGTKVFSQDNNRLETAVSDTPLITVSIVGITGPTNYKPNITVNGLSVILSESADKPLWNGTIDISLPIDGLIIAEHEDGATDSAVVLLQANPVIQSAIFVNGYPLGQTELKENDTFAMQVISDSPISRIDIIDAGATKAQTITFPPTLIANIQVLIANRGNTTVLRASSIIAYNDNGSASQQYSTASAGVINGTNVLLLNNQAPVIAFSTITYPANQQALKGSETADIQFSFSETDSIIFSSTTGELSILNPNTLEIVKTVTRLSGNYNVTSDNLRAVATRVANGATSTIDEIINIANTVPIITVSNAQRLRSGGNSGTAIQNHTISLSSNQMLIGVPSLDNTISAGLFLNNWVGGPQLFSRIMQIHDNDPKGTFPYINLSAIGLSGLETTNITGNNQYILGGFVSRDIFFGIIENEAALGANISDITKVNAVDKDLIQMTYQPSLLNGIRRYSITGPTGVLNQTGAILFWADETEVDNNTTGLSFIRIEEII